MVLAIASHAAVVCFMLVDTLCVALIIVTVVTSARTAPILADLTTALIDTSATASSTSAGMTTSARGRLQCWLSRTLTAQSMLRFLCLWLALWHAALLFLSVFVGTQYVVEHVRGSQATKAASPCFVYLCFHACQNLIALVLLAVRYRRPQLWNCLQDVEASSTVSASWASSSINRQFYHIALLVDCMFLSWTGLGFYFRLTTDSGTEDVSETLLATTTALLTVDVLTLTLRIISVVTLMMLYGRASAVSLSIPFVPFTGASHDSDALGVNGSKPSVRGLSQLELQSMTSTIFRSGVLQSSADDDSPLCAICLCEYEDGESIRELRCQHHYHQPCIDQWLIARGSCPLCVRIVIPNNEARNETSADAAVPAAPATANGISTTVSNEVC